MKKVVFLLSMSFLLVQCTGSNKMVKKGHKLEAAGLYKDASDFYYEGVIRNPKNVNAIIGLKASGQKVLDDHLQVFYKAYSFEDYKKAVYAYLDAKAYYEKVLTTKVELEYPDYYLKYFDESKKIYLGNLYIEGTTFIENSEYQRAEKVFTEVVKIQSDYKDAAILSKVAYVEPYYQKGEADMVAERFRDAYLNFDEVVKVNKAYKDAFELREECQNQAIFTIAFLPFKEGNNKYQGISSKISKALLADLAKEDNPFITIVDRQNTDKLIKEQKLALMGVVDENSAAKAGLLLGVKAVFFGEVTKGSKVVGQLKTENREAYERYVVSRYNPRTQSYYTTVQYSRKTYQYHTQISTVKLEYGYQLVSSETGAVLASGTYQEERTDKVGYATYSGSVSKLYPTRGGSGKRSFDEIFRARKIIASPEMLFKAIYDKISQSITKDIIDYEAQRS